MPAPVITMARMGSMLPSMVMVPCSFSISSNESGFRASGLLSVTTETAPRSSCKTRDVSATFFASIAVMSSPPLEITDRY